MTKQVTQAAVAQDEIEDAVEDINEEESAATDVVVTGSSTGGRLILFMVIVGLSVALGKVTLDVNVLKKNLEPDALLQQDNLVLDSISAQQKNLTTQIKLLSDQQSNLQNSLKTFQNEVELLKQAKPKTGTVSEVTKVKLDPNLELQFLLDRAKFKVHYENDPQGALAILQLIQQKLPKKSKRYQAVQEMIDSIEPMAKLNIAALVDELEKFETKLIGMPLAIKTSIATPEKQTSQVKAANWKDSLWQNLREIVVIQRVDRPVKPLLNEHEQAVIQYQMRLKIQQAKMALLTHQYVLFSDLIKSLQRDAAPYLDKQTDSSVDKSFSYFIHYPFPTRIPDFKMLQNLFKAEKI